MDVGLPDISGLRLAERLLRVRADIPLVLLATEEGQTQSKERNSGIRYFGMKPLSVNDLAETVEKALVGAAEHPLAIRDRGLTIINALYSPRMYYERVKTFLKEYRPLEKRKSRFHFRSIRFNLRYLDAPFKTLVVLGIKDNARLYYWKLLLWSLLTRPRLLPMAMAYHVYGFHFRRVLAVDDRHSTARTTGL
jgi:hypothetical protein